MYCVWTADKKGIWKNLGCYFEVICSNIQGIAILLRLWHRAVLLTGEGGNFSKIKRHLSTRCKAIEKWPGINVLFEEVGTCLSVKLVTCVQTVRYLQYHLYSLIQISFWHLAQKTGCLFYIIFSGGWVWGSHLPYPVPVFVPLYSDSLMKDICCAMPVIYTLIYALENIFWCSKLFVSSSHLCFGVTLYK